MILFTSDLHLNEKNISDKVLIKFAEWLEEMRIIYKISVLVILGDFWDKHLDTKRRVSFDILDAATEFLSSLGFDKIIILKGMMLLIFIKMQ